MSVTQNELDLLEAAFESDYDAAHTLAEAFRPNSVTNLLAVTGTTEHGPFVEFFVDTDDAVDFYDTATDEGAKPDIYKIPVVVGSWVKYEATEEETQ